VALAQHRWSGLLPAPVGDWARGWDQLTVLGTTRTFLLLASLAIPALLALAALAWTWRTYAVTTGIGGWLASAPIAFDVRQWRRQVRSAKGRNAAPGSTPLLGRHGRIPVGGTIRTIGHRGGRSSPCPRPRAPGTWWSSARPGRATPHTK
jgi:plasmid stabilization system protein ParE